MIVTMYFPLSPHVVRFAGRAAVSDVYKYNGLNTKASQWLQATILS